VNCAAIPAGLIESELFGHERGAFTGATERRIGRFELADGGTIFLDEVGELPLELQPKLLRVLQEREFERVGGSRTLRVDVRVIAATNRDLARMVDEGRFRADLFYRLNVVPLRVPPLRERGEDVLLLAEFFLTRYAARADRPIRRIAEATRARLCAYPWPGNVRELENVIERAVILGVGSELEIPAEMLPLPRGADAIAAASSAAAAGPPGDELSHAAAERRHLLAVLSSTDWRIEGRTGAAAILGLPSSTLRSRMRRLGIRRARGGA
jgi:transcriptional regulator with GAF, ATPase, and Fis domain